jgi:hypothetical protein
MGDIGERKKEIEFMPVPEQVPQPVAVPVKEPQHA